MKKYTPNKILVKKARWFELAGDSTRIRMLCYLFDKREACVSEIAKAVDTSIANASHHLQVMRDNGMLETERRGNSVCYKVVNNQFIKHLEKMVCADIKITS